MYIRRYALLSLAYDTYQFTEEGLRKKNEKFLKLIVKTTTLLIVALLSTYLSLLALTLQFGRFFAVIEHTIIIACIYLGYAANEPLYEKICCGCHRICHKCCTLLCFCCCVPKINQDDSLGVAISDNKDHRFDSVSFKAQVRSHANSVSSRNIRHNNGESTTDATATTKSSHRDFINRVRARTVSNSTAPPIVEPEPETTTTLPETMQLQPPLPSKEENELLDKLSDNKILQQNNTSREMQTAVRFEDIEMDDIDITNGDGFNHIHNAKSTMRKRISFNRPEQMRSIPSQSTALSSNFSASVTSNDHTTEDNEDNGIYQMRVKFDDNTTINEEIEKDDNEMFEEREEEEMNIDEHTPLSVVDGSHNQNQFKYNQNAIQKAQEMMKIDSTMPKFVDGRTESRMRNAEQMLVSIMRDKEEKEENNLTDKESGGNNNSPRISQVIDIDLVLIDVVSGKSDNPQLTDTNSTKL